ncbi:hypothetical protein [Agaribacterium sp. ZY112]|uniref:hypothetical protein n=1 Tax=Agaribacterium sp. ZY112 TaxID=3233574 RepID=UPI0035266CE5
MSFDETKAEEMIGKYILVGVTRLDSDEQVLSTEEIHGKVQRVSEEDGIIILQPDGSEFGLPPLLDYYQEADEGVYSLKSSDEKITNPDYLATFNVTATEDDD